MTSLAGHKILWSKTAGSVTLQVGTNTNPNDVAGATTGLTARGGEVVLSVVQACVLLMFNDRRSVTFDGLLAKLGLDQVKCYVVFELLSAKDSGLGPLSHAIKMVSNLHTPPLLRSGALVRGAESAGGSGATSGGVKSSQLLVSLKKTTI